MAIIGITEVASFESRRLISCIRFSKLTRLGENHMALSPRTFGIRVTCTTLLSLSASLFGAISTSWLAACLLGILGTFVFTFVSERILREHVMGKIGKGLLSWYCVHLLGETITVACIFWLFGWVFGTSIASAFSFWIIMILVWLVLCREMLGLIFGMLPFALMMRRR